MDELDMVALVSGLKLSVKCRYGRGVRKQLSTMHK